MKKNIIESLLGIFVLFGSVIFLLIFIDANSQNFSNDNYTLKAKFLKVGGISIGNDVKLRGVKVGVVSKVELNDEYFAVVEFKISSEIKIPDNSSISVFNDGILGNKYLSIDPGEKDEKNVLKEFEEIKKVIDFESIEDQVSKIIFLATQ